VNLDTDDDSAKLFKTRKMTNNGYENGLHLLVVNGQPNPNGIDIAPISPLGTSPEFQPLPSRWRSMPTTASPPPAQSLFQIATSGWSPHPKFTTTRSNLRQIQQQQQLIQRQLTVQQRMANQKLELILQRQRRLASNGTAGPTNRAAKGNEREVAEGISNAMGGARPKRTTGGDERVDRARRDGEVKALALRCAFVVIMILFLF